MRKKGTLFMLILGILLFVPGCVKLLPERVEIEQLNFIRVVGIDVDEQDPDKMMITMLSKKKASGGGEKQSAGSGPKESEGSILVRSAGSFFEAERELQTATDKRIFLAHVQFFLIGEAAAKNGIVKYIDFISRDHDIRSNAKIYIVKDMTAKKFIEKSNESDYFLPDHLRALSENAKLHANVEQLQLIEFTQALNNRHISAIAPSLCLVPQSNAQQGEQEESKKDGQKDGQSGEQPEKQKESIDLYGLAVFKDLALVEFLDFSQSRAVNFIHNQIQGGDLQVKDENNQNIGMNIHESHTSTKIIKEKGQLKGFKIEVYFSVDINEVHAIANVFTEDNIDMLENQLAEKISDEIQQVVQKAQMQNLDYLYFADVFETKQPSFWRKYKSNWNEIFPNLAIETEVKAKINRSYDINQSVGVYEEEHK